MRLKVAGLCLYIALASSGWSLQLLVPSSLPAWETELFMIGVALLSTFVGGPKFCLESAWRDGAVFRSGLLLFAVPTLLSRVRGMGLPEETHFALLCLTPVAIVLVANSMGSPPGDFLKLLAVSLTGLAGAFVLLPTDLSALVRKPLATLVLLLSIASTALGAYTGHHATKDMPARTAVLLMLGPSFAVLGTAAYVTHAVLAVPTWKELPGVLYGAAELGLLVYLVRVWPPIALSARYFLLVLVVACEGLLYTRPSISGHLLLGLALLSTGAVKLLRRNQSDSSTSLFASS